MMDRYFINDLNLKGVLYIENRLYGIFRNILMVIYWYRLKTLRTRLKETQLTILQIRVMRVRKEPIIIKSSRGEFLFLDLKFVRLFLFGFNLMLEDIKSLTCPWRFFFAYLFVLFRQFKVGWSLILLHLLNICHNCSIWIGCYQVNFVCF